MDSFAERSTAILQLTNVPEGFFSANVVPYDPDLQILLPIGRIEHERNGYASIPQLAVLFAINIYILMLANLTRTFEPCQHSCVTYRYSVAVQVENYFNWHAA